MVVWLGLIITDRLYWWYYNAGYAGRLWVKGRWFSENDVLHVALVVWIIYIAVVLVPLVQDAPTV
jgi:hypothetical protein